MKLSFDMMGVLSVLAHHGSFTTKSFHASTLVALAVRGLVLVGTEVTLTPAGRATHASIDWSIPTNKEAQYIA